MTLPATSSGAETAHLPVVADGEGCLEILLDRLVASPGVLGMEANFADSTLSVRYDPIRVSPEQLNALADEIATLFAQRVTYCERRQSAEACEECAIRLGNVTDVDHDAFTVTAEPSRVGVSRRDMPAGVAELVRPLSTTKPWGARMSPAEQETYARGRAMAALTAICLVLLLAGVALDHGHAPRTWVRLAYAASAVTGGWFTLRSTLRSLRRLRFDVNLLMLLAALGAAT